MQIQIPLRLESKANARLHWSMRAREAAHERRIVRVLMHGKKPPALPVVVTLIRIGVRNLDADNLAAAFKAVRDEVAVWLGADDKPGSGIGWVYAQRRGKPKEYAVEIVVTPE